MSNIQDDTDLNNEILDIIEAAEQAAKFTDGLADDKYIARQEKIIDGIAALVARREALAKPGWTIEIPNLKYFQITAFDNSDKQWVTPIFDTANLLASGAALTTEATQGGKGDSND